MYPTFIGEAISWPEWNALRPCPIGLYSAADIYVAPSDNIQETYGLAIVKAMLARLPVVATNWSGQRDLVIDGETGIVIDIWLGTSDRTHLDMLATVGGGTRFEKVMAERAWFDVKGIIRALTYLKNTPGIREEMGNADPPVVAD
jgi:glycosyltransferase involved in cell wall biosynthesis